MLQSARASAGKLRGEHQDGSGGLTVSMSERGLMVVTIIIIYIYIYYFQSYYYYYYYY